MSKYNMRYTILGIQQEKMLEYGLDLTDALLIDTLKGMYSSPSFERIIENEDMYMWINQTFLIDYIPILGSRATLQRRLNKLEELGFIKRIVKHKRKGKKGNFSYISLLPKMDKLTEYNTINNPKTKDSDESSIVDNHVTDDETKVIHKRKNGVKADEIADTDTLSQDDTRPCLKMTQPLYQDDTALVSKRHNKDTLNKDTLNIDTQSINKDRKEKKDRLIDKNPISELSKKYDSEIITIALQKTNQAKQNGTVINNLYAYLKTICEEVKIEQEILEQAPNKSHKTKFHTKEQRSDHYSNDDLEDIARRKRQEYIKRMNRSNG